MDIVIIREIGDTAIDEENSIYMLNSSEKPAETPCVRGTTNEDAPRAVQQVSAPVAADAASPAAAAGKPQRRPSAARALLTLAARGALALLAADALVGRPLQRLSSSPAARFWTVGIFVGIVVILTAANIGNQWKRCVSIQPSPGVADDSPQEELLVFPIPPEEQQTAEAPSPLESSHIVSQCGDIVPQKPSNNLLS